MNSGSNNFPGIIITLVPVKHVIIVSVYMYASMLFSIAHNQAISTPLKVDVSQH